MLVSPFATGHAVMMWWGWWVVRRRLERSVHVVGPPTSFAQAATPNEGRELTRVVNGAVEE